VCSALTRQNAFEFDGLDWISASSIIRQIEILIRKHSFSAVKIGIIENLDVLNDVIDFLKSINKKIVIIWEPVLKTSEGYRFHDCFLLKKFIRILKKITLITPNKAEATFLFNIKSYSKKNDLINQSLLSENICPVLVTGFRNKTKVIDILYMNCESYFIDGKLFKRYSKHGSGCVLSSAIASQLAKGKNLLEACEIGKYYTERFICSNNTMLGYHLF
ncbi:MAG: bifunctional hydroxymethylpyrimidine kinase/phosphomethylpyrimidine kinase, partial [Bacteroidia bacterium]|nr:bifunctional hydroxymethylpyrimidine kinase/phosphomethylpyrimidine kinase [Bacteroidia bacterium]